MTFFHEQTGHLRTWARRTLWCMFVTGALCAIVIPIFSIYRREGDNARSVVEVGPQGVSHTGDYIHVVGSVASVDFEDKNFRVHFEFTPHGTLAGDDGILSGGISISLFYTTLTFPEGQIMRSVDVTMPYMQGATIDYPFDAYKSYFEILANKEREQLHKIPVSLTFLGMLQSVEFIPKVKLSSDELYKISIEIMTRRSPTTIGFSLFIVLIMWLLSIAIGIIAIQVIRKHRISDEHVLTLGITTLFALPALRETQPGIPAIGCAADVLGFYWNMAIIAISSIMILMASALRWKEPSIERELNMVRKQHAHQSKLIQDMAIPMPFPLTGGPFFDHQVKHKKMPFMTEGHLAQQHVHHRQPQSQHHGHHHGQHYEHYKYHSHDPAFPPPGDRKVPQAGYEYHGYDHLGQMYRDHDDLDLASLSDAGEKRTAASPSPTHYSDICSNHSESGSEPLNMRKQGLRHQGKGQRRPSGSTSDGTQSRGSSSRLEDGNYHNRHYHRQYSPPPSPTRRAGKHMNGSSTKSNESHNHHSGSSTLGTQRDQRSKTLSTPVPSPERNTKRQGETREYKYDEKQRRGEEKTQIRSAEGQGTPGRGNHHNLTASCRAAPIQTHNGAKALGRPGQSVSDNWIKVAGLEEEAIDFRGAQ